jgi:spectrin beta
LEVHQFGRDAGVAEAWLLGQEPYLFGRELGQSVDEVEKLIKRHEAFEKSAATWEERFSALERLTTVSVLAGCNVPVTCVTNLYVKRMFIRFQ